MSTNYLHYGEEEIPFTVNRTEKKPGKVSIHVLPDGIVKVDAPANASNERIKKAVQRRARWIAGHLEKINGRRRELTPRLYISGECHWYLGKRYLLKVNKGATCNSVKLIHGKFKVDSIDDSTEYIRDLLFDWYRDHARKVFEKKCVELSQPIPWVKSQPKIRLRLMKKHWGSCSSTGSITLNPHLVKAPIECIEYVITHELCHLKEHNHSDRYWRLLSRVMPEWKQHKKRLDDMAEMLLNT